MLFGAALLLGTLWALYNWSVKILSGYTEYLIDSPWHDHYMMIPVIIKGLFFAAVFFFLTIQLRVHARLHYIEIWKSFLAHLLALVPFGLYMLLNYYGFV